MANGTEVSVKSIIDKFSAHCAGLSRNLVMSEVQVEKLFNETVELKLKVKGLENEVAMLKTETKEPKVGVVKSGDREVKGKDEK